MCFLVNDYDALLNAAVFALFFAPLRWLPFTCFFPPFFQMCLLLQLCHLLPIFTSDAYKYVIAGKYALLSSEAARRNPRQISHANWKDGDVIG